MRKGLRRVTADIGLKSLFYSRQQFLQVGFQFRQDAVSPGRPHQVVQLLGVIDDVKKPGIAAFLEFDIFIWKFSVLD